MLDNEFQTKLKNVLSDPDALSKISAIVSSLGMTNQGSDERSSAPLAESEQPLSEEAKQFSGLPDIPISPNISDPRLALLNSLKPLLREEKRDKIDALTRAITVASMMKMFRK